MKIDVNQPIGKFAADMPGAMEVLEALGIDYACLCDRSLDDAAHAEGIAPDIVVASLRRLAAVQEGETWSDRPLSDLTRHLAQQHHHFVRHELSRLAMLLADICSTNNEVPAELMSLRAAFTKLSETLLPHLKMEETAVFRSIEVLDRAWQTDQSLVAPAALITTLQQLAGEHAAISAQLRAIRDLRIQLNDANDLPPQYGAVLDDLATLESHLHQYIFLENWVLFPRAAMLAEQALNVAETVR